MPDSVLFKKGPLDEEEWRIMKTHTIKGEEICRPMKCLSAVLPIIRSHHERWNGSGYPDGLAGENIPLLARMLQFADIYDALTAARSYKPAMAPTDALRVMQEETDRGWHRSRADAIVPAAKARKRPRRRRTLCRRMAGRASHEGLARKSAFVNSLVLALARRPVYLTEAGRFCGLAESA